MVGIPQAQSQQGNEWLPPGQIALQFEQFQGIDTQPSRAGVADPKMAWCDGFMPLGERNLRTIPGIGTAIYTSPAGLTIIWYDFGNIGTTSIGIILLSDGSLVQVNTATGMTTPIAVAGTIINPSQSNIGDSQWGNQYTIIVANQTNGYFIWDGHSTFTAGTLAPNVSILAGGLSYSSTATVNITGAGGSGATIIPGITNGVITSSSVTNPGTGYTIGGNVTISVIDGSGSGATLSAVIMPFGIQGTAVETYTSRVWVVNGSNITFSAPGSPTNFATSAGGGSFQSTDSFLRTQFTQPKQTNGFLYLIADSSINYISGVQTSGSPPTTTFTNQNADPEIGTIWANTVDVYSRNILFANPFGAHVSYGGAVSKISQPLDGVYSTVPNFGGFTPSAAKAIIFGRKVWVLLIPIIDPITSQQVNKLFLYEADSKTPYWYSTPQDVNLTFIQHQEINSVLTAYGTEGNSIYPLFQRPSVGFTKTVQSKLWDRPHYRLLKTANELFGLVQYYSPLSPNFTIDVDNESSTASNAYPLGPGQVTIINNNGDVVPVVNNFGQLVGVSGAAAGIVVLPATSVGQNGVLLGMTMTTLAADMAVVSLTLFIGSWSDRG